MPLRINIKVPRGEGYTMKKIITLIAITLALTSATYAGSTWHSGNMSYHSDGSSTMHSGNMSYHSDGTSTMHY